VYQIRGLMNIELPSILTSTHTANNVAGLAFNTGDCSTYTGTNIYDTKLYHNKSMLEAEKEIKKVLKQTKKEEVMSKRRIVKVYIVDPDENISLKDAVLYEGKEHFTDLNDQELFFEIDIKTLLEQHNALRIITVNKNASKNKDKDVYLEPIRIRDLKMVVVTIAEF